MINDSDPNATTYLFLVTRRSDQAKGNIYAGKVTMNVITILCFLGQAHHERLPKVTSFALNKFIKTLMGKKDIRCFQQRKNDTSIAGMRLKEIQKNLVFTKETMSTDQMSQPIGSPTILNPYHC